MDARVVKHFSMDGKPYFTIEEKVTPQGHYIEWSGIFVSEEAAKDTIRLEAEHRINL